MVTLLGNGTGRTGRAACAHARAGVVRRPRARERGAGGGDARRAAAPVRALARPALPARHARLAAAAAGARCLRPLLASSAPRRHSCAGRARERAAAASAWCRAPRCNDPLCAMDSLPKAHSVQGCCSAMLGWPVTASCSAAGARRACAQACAPRGQLRGHLPQRLPRRLQHRCRRNPCPISLAGAGFAGWQV